MSINYVLRGDVLGDGSVDAGDAQKLQIAWTNARAGTDPGVTNDQLNIGDVNGDGEISVDDYQRVGRYAASVTEALHDYDWDDIILGISNT